MKQFIISCILTGIIAVSAQENFNIPFPTMGGRQCWMDTEIYDGWRIQKNYYTQHYRLLAPNNVRYAWGAYEGCKTKLEGYKKSENLKPYKEKIVILLHGLGRSRISMKKIARELNAKGLQTISIGYYTMGTLDELSMNFKQILESLDKVNDISIITHSLGAIIYRNYLKENSDKRIKKVIMMAPPNHGSKIASVLEKNNFTNKFTPNVFTKLITGKNSYCSKLPKPPSPFLIIAGTRKNTIGFPPMFKLVEEDNDGVVTVETTKLKGGQFKKIHVSHTFIMNNDKTIKTVLKFLMR